MSNEDDEHYEKWYEKNQEGLVDDFLRDNKQFDRMCEETYEEERAEVVHKSCKNQCVTDSDRFDCYWERNGIESVKNEETKTKTNKGTEGR